MTRNQSAQTLTMGIDIGGTKIAGGIVTAKGRLTRSAVVPTKVDQGLETSLGQVFRLIERLLRHAGGQKTFAA